MTTAVINMYRVKVASNNSSDPVKNVKNDPGVLSVSTEILPLYINMTLFYFVYSSVHVLLRAFIGKAVNF